MVEQHHHLKYNYQVCVRQLYIRLLENLELSMFSCIIFNVGLYESDEAKGY